jgi:hypothetical protein
VEVEVEAADDITNVAMNVAILVIWRVNVAAVAAAALP